jgi:hypothetical protein
MSERHAPAAAGRRRGRWRAGAAGPRRRGDRARLRDHGARPARGGAGRAGPRLHACAVATTCSYRA